MSKYEIKTDDRMEEIPFDRDLIKTFMVDLLDKMNEYREKINTEHGRRCFFMSLSQSITMTVLQHEYTAKNRLTALDAFYVNVKSTLIKFKED